LEAVFLAIRRADPDAVLGWNVIDFDLRVLQTRAASHGLPFSIGRRGEVARVLDRDSAQSVAIARVPGRVVLDGVATLRNASMAFERYTLEFIAQRLLGRGKTSVGDTLEAVRRMYLDDPSALAAYNLEDARLVRDIFEKARLVEFLVARARLTGLLLDRQGGSVAAFDNVYLPRLHRRGYVAPDVGGTVSTTSPGGHVLEGVPGLFKNVVSFDFRSLYPSIIRTFQIDPLGLWAPGNDPVQGFEGATFARDGALLPDILSSLHAERTRAREAGDETLSTAIKILMNSFYGVLGTPGSRFFDARLATSITRRGHEIIERSKAFFEQQRLTVLYGDTDSLFVAFPPELELEVVRARGRRLAAEVNAFWARCVRDEHRLESFLELRMDSVFSTFLMPTLRHSERGSKKRYAGMAVEDAGTSKLVIRGLEAVRTDWTELAREAQRELLLRVFTGVPWRPWLLELVARVERGELDAQLVYRKRLRRDPSAYQANAPHVQAARLMLDEDAEPLSEVAYVMTTKGPQPLAQRSAPIDVEHYLDKQLGPAVDVVLTLLGTSWERLAGRQLFLFREGEA
jgi:DNA polymerase-2